MKTIPFRREITRSDHWNLLHGLGRPASFPAILAAGCLGVSNATPEPTIRYEQRSFYPRTSGGWTTHNGPNFGWRTFESFVLPASETITSFRWSGYYSDAVNPENNPVGPNTLDWTVVIHADNGGQPGVVLFSETRATLAVTATTIGQVRDREGSYVELQEFEFSFVQPFHAEAGTLYWISPLSRGTTFNPIFTWIGGVAARIETRRFLVGNGTSWQAPVGSSNTAPAELVVGDLAMALLGRPALDVDEDGMDDAWETGHGLNPVVDDSQLDPDGDGLFNVREFGQRSDPNNPDTDGDGMSDGVESNSGTYRGPNETGTSPILPDTDRDGLPDAVEVPGTLPPGNAGMRPTDPNLADSDRDGYDDGLEIANGYDPLDAGSFPAPLVLGTGAGALLGHDLTDPEDDVSPEGGGGLNTTIVASERFASGRFNVFDNRLGAASDHLCCIGADEFPDWNWVGATFDEPILLSHFTIASASALPIQNPQVWEIQGSNDGGVTWDSIYLRDDWFGDLFTEASQVIRFDAGLHYPQPAAYKSIRFFVMHSFREFVLGELEFFGVPHRSKLTTVSRESDGHMRLEWSSLPGVTYRIERSTDLMNWSAVQSGYMSGGANTIFADRDLPLPHPDALLYRVLQE